MDEARRGDLLEAGFRFSENGTHAARTMMLAELTELLDRVPVGSEKAAYGSAIVTENILGKPSVKARDLTFRHMTSLFGLDDSVLIFRAMRFLWTNQPEGRPLLALMVALARDPLLRDSRKFILSRRVGLRVLRGDVEAFISSRYPGRFSEASTKSFAQNINGTWTQAGYLAGRSTKTRSNPSISASAVTMALFFAYLDGELGTVLFSSDWIEMLGLRPEQAMDYATEAQLRGQLVFLNAGGVQEVRFPALFLDSEAKAIRGVGHVED